jgi:hypothetical protein
MGENPDVKNLHNSRVAAPAMDFLTIEENLPEGRARGFGI